MSYFQLQNIKNCERFNLICINLQDGTLSLLFCVQLCFFTMVVYCNVFLCKDFFIKKYAIGPGMEFHGGNAANSLRCIACPIGAPPKVFHRLRFGSAFFKMKMPLPSHR